MVFCMTKASKMTEPSNKMEKQEQDHSTTTSTSLPPNCTSKGSQFNLLLGFCFNYLSQSAICSATKSHLFQQVLHALKHYKMEWSKHLLVIPTCKIMIYDQFTTWYIFVGEYCLLLCLVSLGCHNWFFVLTDVVMCLVKRTTLLL